GSIPSPPIIFTPSLSASEAIGTPRSNHEGNASWTRTKRLAMPLRNPVPTRIVLQYPNGRAHETAVERKLQLGDQFELYGRTWAAVSTEGGRRRDGRPP